MKRRNFLASLAALAVAPKALRQMAVKEELTLKTFCGYPVVIDPRCPQDEIYFIDATVTLDPVTARMITSADASHTTRVVQRMAKIRLEELTREVNRQYGF